MFPQRSTYRPMDGLGHGGGGHGGGGHSGGHGGGGHARGGGAGRGARGGFRSGGDYIYDDAPICFCDGVPCPCPYTTFQGMGGSAPGQQAGGAWCGTLGARPPHCQGCIAHPIYTSRLGGMGAYYANKFEQPISGLGSCPCSAQNGTGAIVGTDANYPSPGKIALALGAVTVVVMLALRIKA